MTKYPTGTRHICDGRKRSNGSRASSLLPPTPLPSTGKHRNVLPCLGNIVYWRLALPTMLPGHGSVFLQLPYRHQAILSPPYDPISPPLHQRYRKYQNTLVVKNHPRVSCLLRPPLHCGVVWNKQRRPRAPYAPRIRRKKQKRRRRRQAALRHFLAMSVMIRRNYAPDFNGADPQGVH